MNPSSTVFRYSSPFDGTISRLFLIAGPCVIESEKICLITAERLAHLAQTHSIDIIFKASYDKANRTSHSSYRGPGRERGLKILQKVKKQSGLPVCTDIHVPEDAPVVAEIADILQIPAFLCRQTDLLAAAGKTGRFVNIKKGQFLAPGDIAFAADKTGPKTLLTERGTFFGYGRLVVDFCGVEVMKKTGRPVILDATHSVQFPGGEGGYSGGDRSLALPLAQAAIGFGINGLFFETHPDPDYALCDAANSISLDKLAEALPGLIHLHHTAQNL